VPDLMMDFADSIAQEIDAVISVPAPEAQLDESGELARCRALVADNQLQEASALVSSILGRMIDGGANGLRSVRLLLEHYEHALANQPPLAHVGTEPLPPNDMMYTCFDQFLLLIHRQQRQIQELQAMLAEYL
jgi:hypothetical protein